MKNSISVFRPTKVGGSLRVIKLPCHLANTQSVVILNGDINNLNFLTFYHNNF